MFSLGTSESAPEPYYRLTKASSPSPSTTSAPSSHSSPCTTDSSTMTSNPSEILSVVEDESLTSAIQDILERWNMGLVTSNDIDFLESLSVSAAVYVKLTERIDLLRHGVELIDHHIKLLESPTGLHENIASRLNRLFDRAYGDALDPLGSITLPYAPGSAKQPDASFAPVGLPPPSRHNNLKLRPGCSSVYPTMVIEIAYQNETLDRLLQDAEVKHMSPQTNINVWLGIKVNKTMGGFDFWSGWGRRKLIGYGLRLVEQTEDENGNSAFIKVNAPAPIAGMFTIPSSAIFHPVATPAQVPQDLVIPLEELRLMILHATGWL